MAVAAWIFGGEVPGSMETIPSVRAECRKSVSRATVSGTDRMLTCAQRSIGLVFKKATLLFSPTLSRRVGSQSPAILLLFVFLVILLGESLFAKSRMDEAFERSIAE